MQSVNTKRKEVIDRKKEYAPKDLWRDLANGVKNLRRKINIGQYLFTFLIEGLQFLLKCHYFLVNITKTLPREFSCCSVLPFFSRQRSVVGLQEPRRASEKDVSSYLNVLDLTTYPSLNDALMWECKHVGMPDVQKFF
jgi:hypothetical protein